MILYCIKCGRAEVDHLVLDHDYYYEPDNCQVCLGTSGGVKGNENVINGVVLCDYCTVKYKNGSLNLDSFRFVDVA